MHSQVNRTQEGPFWVVLGGLEDKAGIWLNKRPHATALGRFHPLVPIVVVVKSYYDAELVNSLNTEIFQHVGADDYAGLKAAIEGSATVRDLFTMHGKIYAFRSSQETGIWVSFVWDELEHLKTFPGGAKYHKFDRFAEALLFMIEKEPYRSAAQAALGPAQRIEPGIASAAVHGLPAHSFPPRGASSMAPRAPAVMHAAPAPQHSASMYGGPAVASQRFNGRSVSAAASPVKLSSGAGVYRDAFPAVGSSSRPTAVKSEPVDEVDQILHFMRMMFDTFPAETRALRSLVGPLGWHDPRAAGQAPLTFGQRADEFLRDHGLAHTLYIVVLQARLYSVNSRAFGYALHRELGWPVEDGEELWEYLDLPQL